MRSKAGSEKDCGCAKPGNGCTEIWLLSWHLALSSRKTSLQKESALNLPVLSLLPFSAVQGLHPGVEFVF